MQSKLPLRERKKIQTMTAILEQFLVSLETCNFHEILIDEICDRANVSKVTFFRYFHSKEEVLDYFVMRWCYERSLEIDKNTFSGLEGIRHVFLSAAQIPNAEKILVALIHYYSKLTNKPLKRELTEYERFVISGNSIEGIHVQIYSLNEIIHHYLRQVKGLEDAERELYANHLITLFYGIPFQVHIQMVSPGALEKAYADQLQLVCRQING